MLERTKSQQQGRKDSIVEKREIYSHLKNICFVKIGYLYLNIDFTEFLRKNGEHNVRRNYRIFMPQNFRESNSFTNM